MRLAIGFAILLAIGGPVAAQETSPQPEPILTTGELMLMVIKPAYDELKRAMTPPPADRQQWAQLYQKAARLAEFENLIVIRRERADKPEWKKLATDARKTSETLTAMTFKALSNAGDADFIEVKKAYEDVSGRCNACHRAMSREAPTIKPD